MNKHCLTCNTEFTVGNYSCFCDKTCNDTYYGFLKHNRQHKNNPLTLNEYLDIRDWVTTDKTRW